MKAILALAAALVFAWPIPAQNNCNIELKPLKPVTPVGCADTAPACICNPSGSDCHWTWACVPRQPAPAAPSGADSTIPLQYRPPQVGDPTEMMLRIQQLRQIQEQNEILRQQAEALRQQNELQAQTVAGTTSKASSPYYPYLGLPMISMPKPTGNNKRDQKNWAKWLSTLDPPTRALMPAWSPGAYARVREMAVEQAMKAR